MGLYHGTPFDYIPRAPTKYPTFFIPLHFFCQIIRDAINRHLYNIQRVPDATVIVVVNNYDAAINDATEISREVENRVRSMLRTKDREGSDQGIGGQAGPLTTGSCHVSFFSTSNRGVMPHDLREKVLRQCVSSIELPPAWEFALQVISTLRDKRCPLHNALAYLGLTITDQDILEVMNGPFITKGELSSLWNSIVARVKDCVRGTSNEAVVFNPDSALEGALTIRCVGNGSEDTTAGRVFYGLISFVKDLIKVYLV